MFLRVWVWKVYGDVGRRGPFGFGFGWFRVNGGERTPHHLTLPLVLFCLFILVGLVWTPHRPKSSLGLLFLLLFGFCVVIP